MDDANDFWLLIFILIVAGIAWMKICRILIDWYMRQRDA